MDHLLAKALALAVIAVVTPVVWVVSWWDEAVMKYEGLQRDIRKDMED